MNNYKGTGYSGNYNNIIECFEREYIIELFKDNNSIEDVSIELDCCDANYKHCDPSTGQKCFDYIDIYKAILRFYVEEFKGGKERVNEEFLNNISDEYKELYAQEDIGYEQLVFKFHDMYENILISIKYELEE